MRKTSLDPSRPPKDVFKIKHPRNHPLCRNSSLIISSSRIHSYGLWPLRDQKNIFPSSLRRVWRKENNWASAPTRLERDPSPSHVSIATTKGPNSLSRWTKSHFLRFLYASKFELYKKDGCVERIQQHLKFLKSQSIQPLTTEAESILVTRLRQ